MRVEMFVRGNTNNFQRGFSQHASPAILNYLKDKKGNIVLFHLFPNGILPLVGLGSNEAQHLALGSKLSRMGTRCIQRQESKRQNVATSQHGSSVGVQGMKC